MLTVEQTARILNKFNIAFTDGSVQRYIQNGYLDKVAKPQSNVRDSKYGFAVSVESLVKLLETRGISKNEINEVL